MRRFDSCIFCAILRRRPTILIACVASPAADVVGRAAAAVAWARRGAPRATCASRSAWTIRPAVPVAATSRRSMPSSHARARTAGDAIGRCAAGAGLAATCAGGGAHCRRGVWRRGLCRRRLRAVRRRGLCRCGLRRCRLRDCRRRRRARRRAIVDLDADQLRADREHLPDLAAEREHLAGNRRRNLDRRLVGHDVGEALVLGDRVARLDVPGDELDFGDAFADVGHPDHVHAPRQGSIDALERRRDALRAREVRPLERMRIRRVPAGHALDRRLEVIEAVLLHERDELGAEAAGARRLVDDDAAAGLLHRARRSCRGRAARACAGR